MLFLVACAPAGSRPMRPPCEVKLVLHSWNEWCALRKGPMWPKHCLIGLRAPASRVPPQQRCCTGTTMMWNWGFDLFVTCV